MNVLIVDDHAVNRRLLRAQLEAEGAVVVEAADGLEALDILTREPVDAIISDILMPRMDGYRLCREVRQNETLRALPFILYTSTYNSPSDQQLAESVGADRFVLKPAPVGLLLEALREGLRDSASRQQAVGALPDEAHLLQQYNQVLVHKLEEKNAELHTALGELQQTHEHTSRSRSRASSSPISSSARSAGPRRRRRRASPRPLPVIPSSWPKTTWPISRRSAAIRALRADAEGCLWLGTNADGLHRLKQSRILTFGVPEGLSHEIALGTLEDEEGTLWVATYGGGLNRWKNGSWSSYRVGAGLSSDVVLSLARARGGGLWIGTRGGLDRLHAEHIQPHGRKEGLAAEPVLAVLEDRRGEVWVGTRTGVKRLGSGRVQTYGSGLGLRSEVVLAIHERRDGSLWVGTEGGGLHRFENERFVGVPSNPAGHAEIVTSIAEDAEDTLWLATNRGVERLHHDRLTRHPVIVGLEGTAVYRMLEDESGGLWLSSARGIFRANKRDFAVPGAGVCN